MQQPMSTKKRPFHSVVRRLAGALAVVLAATASWGEVTETNRINVTAKTVWAQATTVEQLPAATDWGYKYSFGYYNPKSSKDDSLWGRQNFVVPDGWANDRLRLNFTAIDSDMIVFVNGRRVAELPQPRGWVDVTGFAHSGTNELMFFTSRTYVSMSRTIDTDPIRREGAWKKPTERPMGLGHKGAIWLERTARPFGLDDAWVTTSFRKMEATVHADVLADTDGEAELELVAKSGGKVAFRASGKVALKKGENEVSVTKAWPMPKLWDTDDGNLYDAIVTLKNGGKVVGTQQFRFGFREVWTDGRNIVMNGHPVHYRVELTWFGLNRETLPLFRKIGRNCIYEQPHGNHWWGSWGTHPFPDEALLDLCDEEGIAVFEPTVNAGCMSRVYNDPLFRRDYLKETRMHMRLYRKHPCVIGWSMSMNSFNPKDAIHPDTLGQRSNYKSGTGTCLQSCAELVREADPTRLVYAHADGNLADIASGNCYPNWTPVQEIADYPETWLKKGDMPYFASEYDAIYCGSFYKSCQELLITEYGAIFYGEGAYEMETPYQLENTIVNGLGNRFHGNIVTWGSVNLAFVTNCPLYFALRDEYVRATDKFWRLAGIQQWAYFHGANYGHKKGKGCPEFQEKMVKLHGQWMQPLLCFIAGSPDDTDKTHVYYPGDTVAKRFGSAFDGKGKEVAVTAKWRVLDASGTDTGVGGTEKWSVTNGGIVRRDFSFKAPDVSKRADYTIVMDATGSDGTVQHDEFAFAVMPKAKAPSMKRRVVLLDPKGLSGWVTNLVENALVLESDGFDLDPEKDILVVGREALAVNGKVPWTTDLVEKGLPVLVLEQHSDVYETFGFRCEEFCARQSFKTELANELMEGLKDSDMGYWRGRPDLLPEYGRINQQRYTPHPRGSNRHAISSSIIEIPEQVGFLPLMQYEFDLNYSPLLRWNHGKGAIVFSTYDFTGRADGTEPGATRFAANLLSYMGRLESGAGKKVLVNRAKPSAETDAVLKAGGNVLNLAFDAAALAERGLSGETADVRRVTFDGELRGFAPANLSRWRDVLHVTKITSSGAGSEGLYFRKKGGGLFSKNGDEVFLQVSDALLDHRYDDGCNLTEKEAGRARGYRVATLRSIERLRQLECRVRTVLGEESPAQVVEAFGTLAKRPGFVNLQSWYVLGPFDDTPEKTGMKDKLPGEDNALKGDTNPNFLYGPKNLDFRKQATPRTDGYVDLAAAMGDTNPNSIGFAVCEYDSPDERDAFMRVGMDYYSRTFVNGEEVLNNEKGFNGPCVPGSRTVKVHFRKGRNVITHKIKSGGAGYGFYCDVSEPGLDLAAHDPEAKEKKRTEWFYDPDYRQNPPYQYHYW